MARWLLLLLLAVAGASERAMASVDGSVVEGVAGAEASDPEAIVSEVPAEPALHVARFASGQEVCPCAAVGAPPVPPPKG